MSFEPTIKDLIDDVEWENITFFIRANSQKDANDIHRKVFDYAKKKKDIKSIDVYMILHENVVLGFTKDTKYIRPENIVTLLRYYQSKGLTMDYNFMREIEDGYQAIKLNKLTVDEILSMKIHRNLYNCRPHEELVAIVLLGCR